MKYLVKVILEKIQINSKTQLTKFSIGQRNKKLMMKSQMNLFPANMISETLKDMISQVR